VSSERQRVANPPSLPAPAVDRFDRRPTTDVALATTDQATGRATKPGREANREFFLWSETDGTGSHAGPQIFLWSETGRREAPNREWDRLGPMTRMASRDTNDRLRNARQAGRMSAWPVARVNGRTVPVVSGLASLPNEPGERRQMLWEQWQGTRGVCDTGRMFSLTYATLNACEPMDQRTVSILSRPPAPGCRRSRDSRDWHHSRERSNGGQVVPRLPRLAHAPGRTPGQARPLPYLEPLARVVTLRAYPAH
jgi:hypothetical protein